MPDPISSIDRISPLALPNRPAQAGQPASALDSFGQILGEAIDSLQQKEGAANQAVTRLASGQEIELHQVMLAMQEADIAFQLALQVRNKLVDAYQEIMRMQV